MSDINIWNGKMHQAWPIFHSDRKPKDFIFTGFTRGLYHPEGVQKEKKRGDYPGMNFEAREHHRGFFQQRRQPSRLQWKREKGGVPQPFPYFPLIPLSHPIFLNLVLFQLPTRHLFFQPQWKFSTLLAAHAQKLCTL